MKQAITFIFFLSCFLASFAQPIKKGQIAGIRAVKPDVGLSFMNTSTSNFVKENTNIGNGTSIEASIYKPLLINAHVFEEGLTRSFGVNLESSYSGFKTSDVLSNTKSIYILDGGSINPQFVNKKGNNVFEISVGPKAKFAFDKFFVAPSIQLGFISIKQKGYSVQDTAVANPNQPSEKSSITFASKNVSTSNGFLLKPQFELGYQITDRLGAFTKASYSFGPTVNTPITTLIPEGGLNVNNTYSYSQLQAGTLGATINKTKWRAFGIGIGITYKF